ncbi:MAG: ABC transporter substrate-binding protein [Desulfobacterales bacterium]|jgi:ABC-type transport system substrate-binding protein
MMTTRRILIFAPVFLILLLLQSYFWVPTYEEQTRGNPQRFYEYMTASIGDASILNPILSADASSSEIESKVFEGLLDYDENLRFRGRLATSWRVYEEAFFYVNPSVPLPGSGSPNARQLFDFLQKSKSTQTIESPALKASLDNIHEIFLIPARNYEIEKKLEISDNTTKSIRIEILAPARIKLVLKQVDQDLFQNLSQLLGSNYFNGLKPSNHIRPEAALTADQMSALAEELLPVVEHNPIIEFSLRSGVKFHDGHEFDAGDVKFTYEAILNPKNLSPRIADYEPVKDVEVIDRYTVRVVYKRLYSPAVGTWAMGILPEHLLSADALKQEALDLGKDPQAFSMRQSAFNRNPIGCGPFVFRQWKSDQYIQLDRFDEYWEGTPNYRKYFFRIIPDLLTQEMEFYAGTLDVYGGGSPPHGIPPHQIERFQSDPRYQNISDTAFGFSYIGYNMRRKPFDDIRVRRALTMAIDINKIIKYVLSDQGERITGPFVKQTDYYNHQIKPLPYDPDAAIQLLAQAGWKPNKDGWLEKGGKRLEFTLITNSGNDRRKSILAIAQDAWKQIGIDVRTDLLEWSVFIEERVDKADFDAVILGWRMSVDPDLYQIWHSSQTNQYQLNFVGFQNQQADDLIIKIRQEYNHDKRVDYCHQLHRIIAREQPYTFLFVRKWTTVLDHRIVVKETGHRGEILYRRIAPTRTGVYDYDFNKWVKLADVPRMVP